MLSISFQNPSTVQGEKPDIVAISLHRSVHTLHVLTFSSTLFLNPIRDLLLSDVSPTFRAELELGLQEALVNAAYHGNRLDPTKTIQVYFAITPHRYLWVITDEGHGFNCRTRYAEDPTAAEGYANQECGRGLMILKQIFDEVQWNKAGNQLRLCKHLRDGCRPVVI
ncbi:ATP-binding protein [Anthocerotibacter panamensis]|uniref:ATP-binding protein n=1 Tax=Anthocerotibacter panamensis TaxID=2857077 RepID=UPI001FDA4A1E|nr:ATP-binding protein [Anthocerotibacter panamensis]